MNRKTADIVNVILVQWVLVLIAVCILPFVAGDFVTFVAVLALINIIAVTGVNVSMGYCGLVAVGHAGFLAIGAYLTTLLMTHYAVPFWLAVPGGAFGAAIAGILIGVPALRLNHLYIAMVTFGFGQAVYFIVLNWIDLTGGPNGMAVPPATVFGFTLELKEKYILSAVICFAVLYVARNLERTMVGRAFVAIRDSPTAATSMGVNVARYKTLALGIGAFLGGLAGGLYALAGNYVNPDAFVFGVSILFVTMCALGGFATFMGPIVGAIVFTVLPEVLRPVAEYKEFVSGIILLVVLVVMPSGAVPLIRSKMRWLRRSPPTAPLAKLE